LLASASPVVIETPEEHERLLTIAEALMDRGDALSTEERKLLELLVLLIEVFESQVEEEEGDEQEIPPPHETLRRLLESRGWGHEVLNDTFGNPNAANEVLAGKRIISKGQAKALGKLFQVPPKLFMAE
jgi:HTH-type transcriptional regulator/antitoxin HigA